MAQDKRLIPAHITWSSWRQLVREMLEYPNIYRHMDYRFWHGEMRLSRLNKIFYLWQTPGRYYSTRWQQYSTFFGETFAYLAAMTVYILLVLTALQLGISTKLLENSASFDRVSAGFAVFSIVGPFGVAFGLFLVFLYFFVDNYRATLRFRDMRLGIIKDG
ncbi:uncharacterized protein J7T54_001277 [Emericellopsis cladophorae]|uniref:Uncharacterized protein n=1 Tax=Emericellopsis cladophorae TaxID=2686198 RepID=A0A9Q0BF86_9HYPO|nr:uncharacterized protein J7T54_001277 [Emericellopsis cladophorae]KAI6782420.1 hypothetical protein J7T54_001277 [Emericellopsis cladophorae]